MKTFSVIFLVVANLFPLAGVLFLGWNLSEVLLIYWAESGVVGLYNVFKMIKASGTSDNEYVYLYHHSPEEFLEKSVADKIHFHRYELATASRLTLINLFLGVFCLFMLLHLAAILGLFGWVEISLLGLGVAVAFLFVSHGVSYYSNFLRQEEYKKVSPQGLLVQPFRRIIVMEAVVIIGGYAVDKFGAPVLALAVLVLLKITLDVISHQREHAWLKKLDQFSYNVLARSFSGS
jgi:hypothetical protein